MPHCRLAYMVKQLYFTTFSQEGKNFEPIKCWLQIVSIEELTCSGFKIFFKGPGQ